MKVPLPEGRLRGGRRRGGEEVRLVPFHRLKAGRRHQEAGGHVSVACEQQTRKALALLLRHKVELGEARRMSVSHEFRFFTGALCVAHRVIQVVVPLCSRKVLHEKAMRPQASPQLFWSVAVSQAHALRIADVVLTLAACDVRSCVPRAEVEAEHGRKLGVSPATKANSLRNKFW